MIKKSFKISFLLPLIMLFGCTDQVYLKDDYTVLLSNKDVGCSMETQGYKVVKEFDSNKQKILNEIVVISYNTQHEIPISDTLTHLCDSCNVQVLVKCKYSMVPHNRSYYGCTGSHLIQIDSILSFRRVNN